VSGSKPACGVGRKKVNIAQVSTMHSIIMRDDERGIILQ